MSCEKAEIPASEKFRAVKKLAQSTKLRQSHYVHSFIENLDTFWQQLSDWTKRISHVWESRFAVAIGCENFRTGFSTDQFICNSQYVWNNMLFSFFLI